MKKRTVHFISELYYPEDTSTGYYVTRIAEGLAEKYEVKVLCAQPIYRGAGAVAPSREIRNGVLIRRCSAGMVNRNDVVRRIYAGVVVALRMFTMALRYVGRGDCVIVLTNPPILPFLVRVACLFRRARFILLVHDVYPDVLVAAGIVKEGSVIVRAIGLVGGALYRSADRIVVIGNDMKHAVAKRNGRCISKIVVIPNWPDTDEIRAVQRDENKLLRRSGIQEKFVVQYMGNMGRVHNVECLAEASRVHRDRKDIHYLFVGDGAKRPWLEKYIVEHALGNVSVMNSCRRVDLCDYLNACDVAVIALLPDMMGVSVPSRMYNIMAAGKPIIAVADRGSDLGVLIESEGIGLVVPPDESDRLSRVIEAACENREALQAMGKRARIVAERLHQQRDVVGDFDTTIANVRLSTLQNMNPGYPGYME